VRAARRRGRLRLAGVLIVGALVTALVLSLGGPTGHDPKGAAAPRTTPRTAAVAPLVRSNLTSVVIAGKPAALPFPRVGEGAAMVDGVGIVASTKNEKSVPVASVTKIMTAYLVLKDHPLVGHAGGPTFVMTAADHQAWVVDAEANDSSVEVKTGERLDERQLLQALMIPSADNIADYLAAWDAGNTKAFVAKMNATAAALHLTDTHFADASGINPGSRGSAVGIVRLAALAMENPVLQSIVDEQFIRLPVTGEIWNTYDPVVGVDGIIGVKSGFTQAAETNLVTAAWRSVHGHRVMVICDVLGQPNTLLGDGEDNEAVLNAVSAELRLTTVEPRRAVVGEALTSWNRDTSAVRVASAVEVVGWPGLVFSPGLVAIAGRAAPPALGWPAGSTIGVFELRYPDGTASREPVVLQSAIRPPPAGWTPPATGG
jgi:D-alanyl-D-alanine carboxypeptidase (penicillin-binding protein 5/6)